MPQMAPTMWSCLSIYFFLTILLMASLVVFLPLFKNNLVTTPTSAVSLNWKW